MSRAVGTGPGMGYVQRLSKLPEFAHKQNPKRAFVAWSFDNSFVGQATKACLGQTRARRPFHSGSYEPCCISNGGTEGFMRLVRGAARYRVEAMTMEFHCSLRQRR